jgi:hypothetical protein
MMQLFTCFPEFSKRYLYHPICVYI